jgi:hypothetical protein
MASISFKESDISQRPAIELLQKLSLDEALKKRLMQVLLTGKKRIKY